MSEYKGKTVIVSGGAEGIGLSIATALGQQGMNVVIGDIDEQQLLIAQGALENLGIEVLAMKMDVTIEEQWKELASSAVERFGKIHMLVNNAGVGSAPGPIEATNSSDWKWVLDVNLMGVVYGTQAVVPLIKQHGEGGWLINTASMAGMGGVPYAGSYTASKVAVVGMSEAWRVELAAANIKVSVLCPAFVKTRIHMSQRNRQNRHLDASRIAPNSHPNDEKSAAAKLVENGIAAELVGLRVVEALDAGEFYIFTHPSHRKELAHRAKEIDAAFARAENSPLLADVPATHVTNFN